MSEVVRSFSSTEVSSGPGATNSSCSPEPLLEVVENVLLLPGWLQRESTLNVLADELMEAGFTVYDLTNSNRVSLSPAQEEQHAIVRLEAIAKDTKKRTAIVGHSAGARAAIGAHAKRPDLVMRTVAISGTISDIRFRDQQRRGISIADSMEPMNLIGITRNSVLEHHTITTVYPLVPLYDPIGAHQNIVNRPEVSRLVIAELRQPQPTVPILMHHGQAVQLAG